MVYLHHKNKQRDFGRSCDFANTDPTKENSICSICRFVLVGLKFQQTVKSSLILTAAEFTQSLKNLDMFLNLDESYT